jgi:hypothetical protein
MGEIISGIPLFSGTVDGPNAQSKSPNVLFNGNSTQVVSHTVPVNQNPIVVQAFNLSGSQVIDVLMMGNDGISSVSAALVLNGKTVQLSVTNTALVIDMPGNYQFRLAGGGLGTVSCMWFASGMGTGSYGLSDFSAGT